MRLEINYRKKNLRKNTNTWKRNNTLLNNQDITEEIRGNQKILETNENANVTIQKLMGCSKNSSNRDFYSNTTLPQK